MKITVGKITPITTPVISLEYDMPTNNFVIRKSEIFALTDYNKHKIQNNTIIGFPETIGIKCYNIEIIHTGVPTLKHTNIIICNENVKGRSTSASIEKTVKNLVGLSLKKGLHYDDSALLILKDLVADLYIKTNINIYKNAIEVIEKFGSLDSVINNAEFESRICKAYNILYKANLVHDPKGMEDFSNLHNFKHIFATSKFFTIDLNGDVTSCLDAVDLLYFIILDLWIRNYKSTTDLSNISYLTYAGIENVINAETPVNNTDTGFKLRYINDDSTITLLCGESNIIINTIASSTRSYLKLEHILKPKAIKYVTTTVDKDVITDGVYPIEALKTINTDIMVSDISNKIQHRPYDISVQLLSSTTDEINNRTKTIIDTEKELTNISNLPDVQLNTPDFVSTTHVSIIPLVIYNLMTNSLPITNLNLIHTALNSTDASKHRGWSYIKGAGAKSFNIIKRLHTIFSAINSNSKEIAKYTNSLINENIKEVSDHKSHKGLFQTVYDLRNPPVPVNSITSQLIMITRVSRICDEQMKLTQLYFNAIRDHYRYCRLLTYSPPLINNLDNVTFINDICAYFAALNISYTAFSNLNKEKRTAYITSTIEYIKEVYGADLILENVLSESTAHHVVDNGNYYRSLCVIGIRMVLNAAHDTSLFGTIKTDDTKTNLSIEIKPTHRFKVYQKEPF